MTNPTDADTLMNNYSLYGEYYLRNCSPFNTLNNKDLLIFMLCYSNCVSFNESQPVENVYLTGNVIADKCISEINRYFKIKDNHFDRKKEFFNKFDGKLNSLVTYYNKAISRNMPLDSDLISDSISPSTMKRVVFTNFFVTKGE
jgi:hypothetical protein